MLNEEVFLTSEKNAIAQRRLYMAQTFSSPPPEWGGGEDIGLHLADFTLLDTFSLKMHAFPL